jgi:DNA repair protein RadC
MYSVVVNTTLPSSLPREKLQTLGLSQLTELELLTLILGSGNAKTAVRALSKKVITEIGGWQKLANLTTAELTQVSGIGLAQASRLVAGVELGRRLFAYNPRPQIPSAAAAAKLCYDITHRKQEYLIGLYLDVRGYLLERKTIAVGSLTSTAITAREIFAPALLLSAAQLILVHNHPSGDPTPSLDDINMTQTLQTAGELLGVRLLDHVIVATAGHCSLAHSGEVGPTSNQQSEQTVELSL